MPDPTAPYDAGDAAPTTSYRRTTATTPDRNNTPVDHTGHDPALCEHAAANPRRVPTFAERLTADTYTRLDTEAATATQERDEALDDLRVARAEIANLRAQLDAVNAGRSRLQDELDQARARECSALCRDVESDRDRLAAELDELRPKLAKLDEIRAAYDTARDALSARDRQWQAEVANIRDLVRRHEPAGQIPVAALWEALRTGPAGGLDAWDHLVAERDQARAEHDALNNRVRLLLVNPNGDRQDHDTITVAELRDAINGDAGRTALDGAR